MVSVGVFVVGDDYVVMLMWCSKFEVNVEWIVVCLLDYCLMIDVWD